MSQCNAEINLESQDDPYCHAVFKCEREPQHKGDHAATFGPKGYGKISWPEGFDVSIELKHYDL